jgi:hypothetical protein
MITSNDCFKRFGAPETELHMVLLDVPTELEIGVLPRKVYCNRLLVSPLQKAFKNIIDRRLIGEVKTWDGCFNIRKKKGNASPSLHSWGLAIDINAAWNGYNKPTTMSKELVACFTDAGFEWGGNWRIKDGMHFQLAKLI